MKRLLVLIAMLVAVPAWGQPSPTPGTGPTAGSAAPGSGSGSGSARPDEPGVSGGATTADPNPSLPRGQGEPGPGTKQPVVPTVPGQLEPAKPPQEWPLEPGAIETSKDPKDPCGDLLHKPWYEQLTCRPHDAGGTYWMPTGANRAGDGVDNMFYVTLALSAFFFFAITGCVVYFVIKYRGRKGHRAIPSPSHNDTMEVTWTVIPTIIVVFLFYYGWRGYINMVTPPQKAVEIQVVAQKWNWSFVHPNGITDRNLHVPVNTAVRLVMTSTDVLHSFFIPAMRTKQDVVPRRFTYVWFEATKPGTYRLYCTEYCGTDHSLMKVNVVVHQPGSYERYLAERAESDNTRPLDQIGADQFIKRGCNACHTLDGTRKVGPSFKDIYGSTFTFQGKTVKVDDDYIRESLLSPAAKFRPDYANVVGQMPSFEGQMKERQIEGMIEFIKKQSTAAETPPSK